MSNEEIKLPPLPESLEIEWPELHRQALGCGVEDRGIRDRYDAAEYGWQDGVDRAVECVPEAIYDADQMNDHARAAILADRAASPLQGENERLRTELENSEYLRQELLRTFNESVGGMSRMGEPVISTPVKAPSVREAARAVIDVALQEAVGRVHTCDQDNSDIKAKTLSEEMQALYRALQGKPEAPADDTPPPCDEELHKNGAVVAVMQGGKLAMEGLVKEASRNGLAMDWHYFGGRAVVKTMGNVGEARKALQGAIPGFLDGE